MKFIIPVILALLSVSQTCSEGLQPVRLTCENMEDPAVIDTENPRLSWINHDPASTRGQMQTAWQIIVASSENNLLKDKADLWNSGKITSPKSFNIPYSGIPLESRQDCWWKVRVWDKDGKMSDWSEPAKWSMGLLDEKEWQAVWIGAPWQGEDPIPDGKRPLTESRARQDQVPTEISNLEAPPPAPLLRKEITISKKIASAKAYVTGLGYFEFYVNGMKAGNEVLVPNQTNYGKRPGLMNNPIPLEDNFREYKVFYLSYDITSMLKNGQNAFGAIVGNGFYNAPINWTESYGTPRFLCQVYIRYTDGSSEMIPSDTTWKASKSPVLMDLVFDGEHYDARLEQQGWNEPGFDDTKWENAARRQAPYGKLEAQMSPPDRVMETIDPVSIEKVADGHFKVDFGQEISGWVHLKNVNGPSGRKIKIRYVHQTPSGDNSYTLSGKGNESYSARFTWFVFRNIEITGWTGELKPENISAEAVYTDVETTGKFESSNKLFNDINRIWWRSQTDNMHGCIASDCPNRERSPYTGDGQVACVTVMHNFDARAFYTKWIRDILGAQNVSTGYVPNGAPWQPGCGGGVAWGAAMNIMPWEYYLHYGDTSMLSDNYDGMKGYIKYMLTWTDKDGIMFSQVPGPSGKPNRWMNLGDWVAPGELPPDKMVHTFYLWRCADLTARCANVLGKKDESEYYAGVAERTRKAFMEHFWNEEAGSYGKYGGNIFALKMGVPDDRKSRVLQALKNDIAANGGHLDTGIFGTQFFFEVLSENGLNDLAYEAMNKKTMPGYGWWLEQGVTTSWEHWDKPGSGNHPMFGGGMVWLYRKLAGMQTDMDSPGYKNIIFRPQPAGDLESCSYSNLTPFGTASVSWTRSEGKFRMTINVPVGSTARVYVPSVSGGVTESGKKIPDGGAVKFLTNEAGYSVFSTGSGRYIFESGI